MFSISDFKNGRSDKKKISDENSREKRSRSKEKKHVKRNSKSKITVGKNKQKDAVREYKPFSEIIGGDSCFTSNSNSNIQKINEDQIENFDIFAENSTINNEISSLKKSSFDRIENSNQSNFEIPPQESSKNLEATKS